jgi:hypothetical protein
MERLALYLVTSNVTAWMDTRGLRQTRSIGSVAITVPAAIGGKAFLLIPMLDKEIKNCRVLLTGGGKKWVRPRSPTPLHHGRHHGKEIGRLPNPQTPARWIEIHFARHNARPDDNQQYLLRLIAKTVVATVRANGLIRYENSYLQ